MKLAHLLLGACLFVPTTAWAQSDDENMFGGVKVGVSVDRRTIQGEYDLPRLGSDIDTKRSGIGYRGHVGYDAQIGGAFVIGVEGGIGAGGRSIRAEDTAGTYRLKPRYDFDVSGRVGVTPTPNLLVYGRAGHSWLRARERSDFVDPAMQDLNTKLTEKGFLWGGGAEAALMRGVYARAEYNRINYGDGLTARRIQLGMSLGF